LSPPEKKLGPKRAKLGQTSDHFKRRSQMSPKQMETSKIGKTCDRQRFLNN